jgi:hypothetical protein
VAAAAGRLDAYSISTGARLHSWGLPAGTAPHVGVVYAYSIGERGTTAPVPMSAVEAALGLA